MTLILIYLATGLLSGFLAGLFGIGGGLIIVPLLLLSYRLQGLPESISIHLAVGTSLACIVFTALSSVRAHMAKVELEWRLVLQLSAGMVCGALLGGDIAAGLSATLLQQLIGLFALVMALQIWCDWRPQGKHPHVTRLERPLVGTAIGVSSALFGIGGGTLIVPYLRWRHVPMVQAIAISAACGIPVTVSATISYIYHGWREPALPAHAFGFVYWPALLGIVLTSTLTARLGVRLAHRLSSLWLRRSFALLQLLIAIKFLFF